LRLQVAGRRLALFFGAQSWKIQRITHNDVFVTQAQPINLDAPFWKNEGINRDFHFSSRISAFLETANQRLEEPEFFAGLQQDHGMDSQSAFRLIDFLKAQKIHTRCDLPHQHHLLLETVRSGPGAAPGNQLVLHTFWGGRVNRPLAMALDTAWEERFGQRLEVFSGNDCIVLHLPHDDVEAEDILSLVTSSTLETLLKKRLESTGFFGARFRECAGRSLLIVGNNVHERMPLWMNRLRSQKLLNTVQKYEDFPILLETWRTCLQDEFEQKRQRLSPGYSPQSPRDLIDWIKDRLFIPMHEWEMLQFAMQRDLKADPESIIWQVQDKIARILPPRADGSLIAAWERVPLLMDVFYHGIETVQVKQLKEETENKIPVVPGKTDDPDERTGQFCALFGEWLQYYGPRTPEFIQNTLGLSGLAVETSLENLLDSRTIIKGRLIIDGKEDDICDSENFEILLRRHRMEAVPPFEPLAIGSTSPLSGSLSGINPARRGYRWFVSADRTTSLPSPSGPDMGIGNISLTFP